MAQENVVDASIRFWQVGKWFPIFPLRESDSSNLLQPSGKIISNFPTYGMGYDKSVGRYTIHQIPIEEVPPVSKNAARKLTHPPGSFAAYHPDPLLAPGLAPLPHWDSAARAAEAAIKEFERQYGDLASRVGWVLQRSESVGSSTIEDVNPSLRRVVRSEAIVQSGGDPQDEAANEAIGSIAATRLSAEIGDDQRPITLDDLLAVHATLMDHTPKPEAGGHLRPSWVRVGGVLGGYPPPAYVAPPAEEVPELMDDLLEYINTTNHHPVTAAAIAHVQFESIHPFRDGNGRAGRALVQTILRKGGVTRYSTPPISAVLAFNRDEYIDALAAARFDGEAGSQDHVESLDSWVSLFSSTTETSCDYAEGLMAKLDAVIGKWDKKLKSRRGSAARKIADHLPEMPVFTVQGMAAQLSMPLTTAYRAADRLVAAGIVAPVRGKHRGRDLFEALDILDVFKTGAESAETPGLRSDDLAQTQTSRAASKEETAAEAIRLRQQGRTLQEIANALGMSTSWAQLTTKGVRRGGQGNQTSS